MKPFEKLTKEVDDGKVITLEFEEATVQITATGYYTVKVEGQVKGLAFYAAYTRQHGANWEPTRVRSMHPSLTKMVKAYLPRLVDEHVPERATVAAGIDELTQLTAEWTTRANRLADELREVMELLDDEVVDEILGRHGLARK